MQDQWSIKGFSCHKNDFSHGKTHDQIYNMSDSENDENINANQEIDKSCSATNNYILFEGPPLLEKSPIIPNFQNKNLVPTTIRNTSTQDSEINKFPKDKTTEPGLSIFYLPLYGSNANEPTSLRDNVIDQGIEFTSQDATESKVNTQVEACNNIIPNLEMPQIQNYTIVSQTQPNIQQIQLDIRETQLDTLKSLLGKLQTQSLMPEYEELMSKNNELLQEFSQLFEPRINQQQLLPLGMQLNSKKIFKIRHKHHILRKLAEKFKKMNVDWSLKLAVNKFEPKIKLKNHSTYEESKKNRYKNFGGKSLNYSTQPEIKPLIVHLYLEILKENDIPEEDRNRKIEYIIKKFGNWINEINKNKLSSKIKIQNMLNIDGQTVEETIFRRTLHFIMLHFLENEYDAWISESIQLRSGLEAQKNFKDEIKEFIKSLL